tara:strand:- start:51092 stop:51364 length:273 start_codon:yes stop_codon:yes gene_type:complete
MVVRNRSSATRGGYNVSQDNAMLKLLLHTIMPDMEKAAILGHKALCEGKGITDNPYDNGSNEFQAWDDSWWYSFYNPELELDLDKTVSSV